MSRALSPGRADVSAHSILLAYRGFEASPQGYTRFSARDSELARVRGTHHDPGDSIRMALKAGPSRLVNWSSCYAVAWDQHAPEFGVARSWTSSHKHSYPLGIIANVMGQRFVDEGADFWNLTYTK